MSRSNPIKSAAKKNCKIMVVVVGCWTKMVLLIVTAGYTEASKIQTTGPIRPKFDFKLSKRFTIKIY